MDTNGKAVTVVRAQGGTPPWVRWLGPAWSLRLGGTPSLSQCWDSALSHLRERPGGQQRSLPCVTRLSLCVTCAGSLQLLSRWPRGSQCGDCRSQGIRQGPGRQGLRGKRHARTPARTLYTPTTHAAHIPHTTDHTCATHYTLHTRCTHTTHYTQASYTSHTTHYTHSVHTPHTTLQTCCRHYIYAFSPTIHTHCTHTDMTHTAHAQHTHYTCTSHTTHITPTHTAHTKHTLYKVCT